MVNTSHTLLHARGHPPLLTSHHSPAGPIGPADLPTTYMLLVESCVSCMWLPCGVAHCGVAAALSRLAAGGRFIYGPFSLRGGRNRRHGGDGLDGLDDPRRSASSPGKVQSLRAALVALTPSAAPAVGTNGGLVDLAEPAAAARGSAAQWPPVGTTTDRPPVAGAYL